MYHSLFVQVNEAEMSVTTYCDASAIGIALHLSSFTQLSDASY